jgi:hypothetical protein
MQDPASDSESLENFVARISDVLRFIFAEHRNDTVVLVGENEGELLRRLQAQRGAAPPAFADADPRHDVVSGETRIRRLNNTVLVAL